MDDFHHCKDVCELQQKKDREVIGDPKPRKDYSIQQYEPRDSPYHSFGECVTQAEEDPE
jgi:hypothetical protein